MHRLRLRKVQRQYRRTLASLQDSVKQSETTVNSLHDVPLTSSQGQAAPCPENVEGTQEY